jgi:hypothetical protein
VNTAIHPDPAVLYRSPAVHLRHTRLVPAALVLLLAGAGCPSGGADAAPGASGSSASSAVAAPADGPPSPPIPACPVPVCRYQGTSWAETLVGDELVDRGEARITWRFSHMSGREAIYVAAGSVTAAWTTDRCTITLQPAAHAFNAPPRTAAAPSRLQVDFTTRPVRYTGTGHDEWPGTQTWACVNDQPFDQDGVSTTWFEAQEMTSDDPGLLKGTYEGETVRSGWEFTNAP